MSYVQTLTLNKKKFALLPFERYEKLLEQIEDLLDLKEVKKRAKEPRIPLEEVRKQFLQKNINSTDDLQGYLY